uniref:Eukaryotic translation initiation factor 3 subunit C n=1 Tax=Octactis speculum TaxID=3111310 RepID=A0A7S2HV13_9STRA|mmetsp:Transcript_9539/g.12403  ORF Transcript_9539/g.12403 Transcript_9539/m.12403 type:complete len:1015 (+) Transcript_9539:48-3092(+)|eukprot:CAMPEP_0185765378 /NCGR_PEP_ID=MMETSP1174-20130828/28842_1 /TAXON_ID=35687 /ORGANISM="Dictyocha speculum, Strain CCMP1381" /LENGTH=1014 /DNA_ID=CAMNT_0028448465 /DNA_START=47 /DNA_END=3091 /DNA_ORIENTATION=-
MSRFWAGQSSASGTEDSDSDSASSSDGEANKLKKENRWAVDSDSESEEENRKVVSAKDKAWIAMESDVKNIKNSMKNNDWAQIQETFDDLNRKVEKQQNLIKKEGGVPRFYIRLLAELEDLLLTTLKDKDAQKKMNKANGRALNRMKLNLRKHNLKFETEIKAYRENPEEEKEGGSGSSDNSDASDSDSSTGSDSDSDSSSDDDSDDDSESDDSDDGKKKAPKKSLDEMDSDDWASSSESEEEDSDEDVVDKALTGRDKWLKTNTVETKRVRKDKTKKPEQESKKADKSKTSNKRAEFSVSSDISEADLKHKIIELVSMRGRRNTDPKELIKNLNMLCQVTKKFGPRCEIPALCHLVSSFFDMQRNMDDFMDLPIWKTCHGHMMRISQILNENPELVLTSIGADDIADMILAQQGNLEEVKEEPKVDEDANKIQIIGNLVNFVNRLDEEYTKALQKINPHTVEYVVRLRMESQLVKLCTTVQQYYERIEDMKNAASVALLCIEHVYYMHDSIAAAVFKAQKFAEKWGAYSDLHPACMSSDAGSEDGKFDAASVHPASIGGKPTITDKLEDVGAFIQEQCHRVIYKHGDDRTRTRAMLCHIAHHAAHDRFYEARDLLLMSHLQEHIGHADVHTQILFNRAMVMLGLCAFRAGLIWDAHQCLSDICSSRVKELLAQGLQSMRYSEKNPEQENAERRRQTPYHMHINLDLLEGCHLTAAMLLEVPNMATEDVSERPRVISRHFRKHMDFYERQVFTGPPENVRDHVLAAAKALTTGEWKKCTELILDDMDIWNLIPGEKSGEAVKKMLLEKIKAEALRTYLFAYSAHYDSLSLPQLCNMFALEKRTAHGIISKMMINQELHASWDQPTDTVVLHKVEPTHLQALALQYADKASMLVESNERFLEASLGGGKENWNDRQQGNNNWHGNDNRRQWNNNNHQSGTNASGGRWGNNDNRGGHGDQRNNRNNNNHRSGGGGGGWNNNDRNQRSGGQGGRNNNNNNWNNRSGGGGGGHQQRRY